MRPRSAPSKPNVVVSNLVPSVCSDVKLGAKLPRRSTPMFFAQLFEKWATGYQRASIATVGAAGNA